jgi:hypothetical protein
MDEYWNKKTTILRYDEKLYKDKKSGKINSKEPKIISNEDLFEEAQQSIGTFNFNEEVEKLEINDFFCHLSYSNIKVSITIGIMGALTAIVTDMLGKPIEQNIFTKFDKNHPADFMRGQYHRYHYGHDILNPFEKLPKGFQYHGVDVGGKSLFKMVGDTYCPNNPPIQKLFSVVGHNLVHYFRDFITPDGLPLPGSSIFTQWENNLVNRCGFSSSNELMDSLGREFGSIKASDFTSIILMKTLSSFFIKKSLSKKHISKNATRIFENQISTITTSTCLIIQLFLLLFHFSDITNVNKSKSGAKLNLGLMALFTKNIIQLISYTSKEHKELIDFYDKSIDLLNDEILNIEDWRNIL